jgi:hypothetical protein
MPATYVDQVQKLDIRSMMGAALKPILAIIIPLAGTSRAGAPWLGAKPRGQLTRLLLAFNSIEPRTKARRCRGAVK